MTAPELTAEERRRVDAFESACQECQGATPLTCLRAKLKCCPDCTHTAAQLIAAAREALARVEAVCAELDREGVVQLFHGPHNRNGHITDRIRAAIAAPVAGQHTTDEEG